MKILIYADLHIYNHHKMPINSETALGVLDYIKEYSEENNISKIVCAGDFFHTKAKSYAPHVVQAWLRIKDINKLGIDQYLIVGNHDMAMPNTSMNSILFVFSNYSKIIPDYYFEDIGDTRVHFLSYTTVPFDNFIFSKTKKNVLIGHLDVIGFKMSNGYRADSGFKIADFDKFDLVFSGHYHSHQIMENIVYVGSPYQTSFAERDQNKGFIVFDTDSFTWEFVETPSAPKYKIIEIEDIEEINEKVSNDFIRIKLANNEISKTKLKEKLFEMGAISVDIVPKEDAHEIQQYYEKDIGDSPSQIAREYLKSLSNKSLEDNMLMNYFEKIQEISGNITEYEV